jgi:ubiquinone/menaquinone biosynthesis C-methylase UbiE
MTTAMRRMEDKLGQTLALPPGARVLDAGCGEGDVAVRLGTRFGLEVDGVDLLEANLRRARAKAARLGLAGSLRFRRLDYGELAFPDECFDGAYTMETLGPRLRPPPGPGGAAPGPQAGRDPGPVRVPGPAPVPDDRRAA